MAGLLESLVESAGQAGTALDKLVGGRAVRGAMAGRPRELLSAIPFSDTLGFTDPDEAAWGRDVLDAWGVTKKGQPSMLGDLAGFGLDVAAGPGAVAGAATLGKGAAKGFGRAAAGGLRSLDDALFKYVDVPGVGQVHTLRFTPDEAVFRNRLGSQADDLLRGDSGSMRLSTGAGDDADELDDLSRSLFGDSVDGEALGDEILGGPRPEDQSAEGLFDSLRKLNESFRRFSQDESGAVGLGRSFDVDEMLTRAGMGRDQHLDLLHAIEGRFGGDREKAAAAMLQGPRYGGGDAKLAEMLGDQPHMARKMSGILADPTASRRLADELPPGSSILGAGEEGVAFRTPQGHVVRVEQRPGDPVARPDLPIMALPFRSAVRGGRTIEHLPAVTPFDSIEGADRALSRAMMFADPNNPAEASLLSKLAIQHKMLDDGIATASARVRGDLVDAGWPEMDWHNQNVGFLPNDRMAILDPNVLSREGFEESAALEQALRRAHPTVFGQPEATPPGGFRLARNERPEEFLWPLMPDPGADPAFYSGVRQESARLGVPDLIREFVESQGSRPPESLVSGVAAPEIAGASRLAGQLGEVGRLFNPETKSGSREALLDLVRRLDLGDNGEAGTQLLGRLQGAGLPVSWNLEYFLKGLQPRLWATLPFAAVPAAMYANAENN